MGPKEVEEKLLPFLKKGLLVIGSDSYHTWSGTTYSSINFVGVTPYLRGIYTYYWTVETDDLREVSRDFAVPYSNTPFLVYFKKKQEFEVLMGHTLEDDRLPLSPGDIRIFDMFNLEKGND